jgi:hypothetical protein
MTEYQVEVVERFLSTFMQAQKTKNFQELEKLYSFKLLIKYDNPKDYRKMKDKKLYHRYPSYLDDL